MSEATIFAAALEKAREEERAAYLAEACAGDEPLRRRVEALLRAHAGSDAPVVTDDYAPISERPGTRIGPYRLMEQIGEGGFGRGFVAGSVARATSTRGTSSRRRGRRASSTTISST